MFPSPNDMPPVTYDDNDMTSLSSLGVVGDMLTTPAHVDWVRESYFHRINPWETNLGIQRLYDSHMFGYDSAMPDGAWQGNANMPVNDFGFQE